MLCHIWLSWNLLSLEHTVCWHDFKMFWFFRCQRNKLSAFWSRSCMITASETFSSRTLKICIASSSNLRDSCRCVCTFVLFCCCCCGIFLTVYHYSSGCLHCWHSTCVFTLFAFSLSLTGIYTRPVQPFPECGSGGSHVCFSVVPHPFHSQVPALHGLPYHWPATLWGS